MRRKLVIVMKIRLGRDCETGGWSMNMTPFSFVGMSIGIDF
jgi:hypothetical protein